MTDQPPQLDELIDAWRYARQGFIAEARNIPAPDWAYRPTPENRNVTELVRHIVESGLMGIGEVTDPDGDLGRRSFDEHMREYAGHLPDTGDRETWLELLEETLDDGVRRLREAGEELMMRPIRQFNGEPARRLTWFHHSIAHEEYHRGQLALYARLTGHVPALTQRIEAG